MFFPVIRIAMKHDASMLGLRLLRNVNLHIQWPTFIIVLYVPISVRVSGLQKGVWIDNVEGGLLMTMDTHFFYSTYTVLNIQLANE